MEVTRITFQADEQNLVKTGGLDVFASDTVSYIEAVFSLGTNWTGFDSVRAMWKFGSDVYSTVLDHEGKCIVPWEVLTKRGELKVNLVGSIVEDDVLTDRLTTFPVIALIISKIAQVEGENTAEITPSEFEQFVAVVKDDADRAEDARDEALTAKDEAGDYALYAKDYSESAESYRDEAKGYAEDAEEASQSILGLDATALVDANVGTPSVNVSVSEVSGNKVMDFDFHNLKGEQGEQGEQGEDGADGFSPVVAVSEITGGHEVTITDAQGDHSFDVMDGNVENFYPFLPTDSASGSIASFPDGANDVPMLSLVAEIEPIQNGTPTFYGTEQTPYFLKAITNGNTEDLSKIVGGTVAVNQLVRIQNGTWSGLQASIDDAGVITVTGTSTGGYSNITAPVTPIDGHKYLNQKIVIANPNNIPLKFGFLNSSTSPYTTASATSYTYIMNVNSHMSTNTGISDFSVGTDFTGVKLMLQVIDLTQMFGTTIADYLYTLESGTAGAGVAKLREWGYLTDTYIPYNAGTLVSVSGLTYHKTYDGDGNVLGQTALDSSLTLRGIPKLDASNNLYYDGDEYLPSGNVNRRYGIVDLGSLAWTRMPDVNSGYYTDTIFKATLSQAGMISRRYNWVDNGQYIADGTAADLSIGFALNGRLRIKDLAYTSQADFKASLSGNYLVYELPTATTETATPYQGTMPIVAGGTEQFIGSPIPVGNSSTYHDVFPISGRTEVKTVRASVNQWDEEWESGGISTSSGQPVPNIYQIRSKNFCSCKPNTNYYLLRSYVNIFWYDSNKDFINAVWSAGAKTSPSNAYYFKIRTDDQYGTTYNHDISINYPSTDHDYHAYLTPLTITTQLGQTVYGGTLDVVSGVLTVDRAMVTVDENDTIQYASNSNGFLFYCISKCTGAKNNGIQICDRLSLAESGAASTLYSAESGFVGYPNGIFYFKINTSIATVADMKSYLSSAGAIQACYELATPITYQLTPTEVRTLLGTNNIWSDSGDTQVTYKADIQKYIDKQISAVLNA